ncbi:MAG: tRNA (adenosine(37)-N6)-threonylcarbamoyltransferase complex dimerization subunit type 1 TsaB [Rhodobacteraceae bacterium]|nr:tRNA (adenosine(37)-N6)-threonylcarbamoyltransferase complex dimerization subunit type 1 TsaB [Paracoccaceae bacterium]
MLILAFDTSAAACHVCLWRDGNVIADASREMARGQAEALVPMIDETMSAARAKYDDLDRVAVGCGPGSFTGVRVALAAAHGIALAANVPAVGVATTEVYAASARKNLDGTRRILAVVDSKRGDLFVQLFDNEGISTQPPAVVAPEALAAWCGPGALIVAGDAVKAARDALAGFDTVASDRGFEIGVLAALAAEREPDPGGPAPLYLRPPDITPDPTGGRLRP